MNVNLIVIGGERDGMKVPIAVPAFQIGRAEGCHVRAESDLASPIHCQLLVADDSIAIEDCGSDLGTFVNGERIRGRHSLANGDLIKIATMEFEVRLTADELDAAQAAVVSAVAQDDETNILQWVKQEDKVSLSSPKVVMLQYPKLENARNQDEKRTARGAVGAGDANEFGEGVEWDAGDLLLLAFIGLLTLVLLVLVPTLWIWRSGGGLLLVALVSACVTRINRLHELNLDGLNAVAGVLAALVLSLMLPAYWMWLGVATVLLTAIGLMLAFRARQIPESRWDATNMELLAAMGLLACIVLSVHLLFSDTFWLRLGSASVLVLTTTYVLSRPRNHKTRAGADRFLWLLTAIGVPLILVLGFLFPIASWWPEWLNLKEWPAWITWDWFKREVLRNWWCLPGIRWGLPLFWIAMTVVLLLIRAWREHLKVSRG